MTQREVVVVGAARTAVGSFGCSLKDVPMTPLASTAVKAALERSGAAAEQFGHAVFGNVIPTDTRDAERSTRDAMRTGTPTQTPAFKVNRPCRFGAPAVSSGGPPLLLGAITLAKPLKRV